jgi:predicted  nucleic acid-binding Zn-ribbon protein
MAPEVPDVVETANFLRRFADLMSVGQNATYLLRAAVLLETLEARVTAAADEEQLWRVKHETVTRHAGLLEAECESLKHDIDGHLNITSSILSERDALAATLRAREAGLSGFRDALDRERGEHATKLETHEEALAGLRAACDREGEALKAALQARGDEFERLRDALQRERDDLREQLKAREDELATLRDSTGREHDALREKIAALESRRAELRSTFDRISHLSDGIIEHRNGAGHSIAGKPGVEAELNPPQRQRGGRGPVVGEADTVVAKATLRQARAQFKHLAGEFTGIGDVASRVMCELGAHTMDQALGAGREVGSLPVGDIALGILASPAQLL